MCTDDLREVRVRVRGADRVVVHLQSRFHRPSAASQSGIELETGLAIGVRVGAGSGLGL